LLEQRADIARARPLLEESPALRRTLGEPRGVATTLSNVGVIALLEGEPDRAAGLFAEQLTLAQQAGLVPHTAWALTGLGLTAVYQNDKQAAVPLLRQALRLAHDLGDRLTVAECLAGLAAVTADPAAAARLWGRSATAAARGGVSACLDSRSRGARGGRR
jgi:tetratricopeptide (TPR) repeat protein